MTKRLEKVNSLLEHEIGKIISREVALPDGALVTLTKVEATSNLIEARVYISAYPAEKTGQVMDALRRDVGDVQEKINKKLNMRPIPKIIFVADKNSVKANRVEELLESLKKQEK